MMIMRIRGGENIKVGCSFFRYIPAMNFAYDKGEVTKCQDGVVEVDFGDTLVMFLLPEIAYGVNTDLGEEHYMSVETGVVLADYRSSPQKLDNAEYDPVLASFEELLKRI